MRYHKKLPIHEFNVHQLILTSYLFANKMHLDKFYSNAFVAKLGGISVSKLFEFDKAFLEVLDYQLMVTPEDYENARNNLNISGNSFNSTSAWMR
jgi:hypothetical protein